MTEQDLVTSALSPEGISRSQVEPCLYNWLGYGNPDSPWWFLGIEEGGAEIWRKQAMTGQPGLSLAQSLQLRAGFKLNMDLAMVWDSLYGLPLSRFKGATVWRYVAAVLFALEGKDPSLHRDQLMPFVSKQLSRLDSRHFHGEFLPLPKISAASISPYEAIWPRLADYHREVIPGRLRLIRETLARSPQVRTLICYDRRLAAALLEAFQAEAQASQRFVHGKQVYTLTPLHLPERRLFLFQTPFFGQGQISYEGIWAGVGFLLDSLANH